MWCLACSSYVLNWRRNSLHESLRNGLYRDKIEKNVKGTSQTWLLKQGSIVLLWKSSKRIKVGNVGFQVETNKSMLKIDMKIK